MGSLNVQQVALAHLKLDPRNPRIAPMTDSLSVPPVEEWILMALGKFSSADEDSPTATSYSSLKESIRASGGVMQPIIVVPEEGGGYTVIEGNTRVAIYHDLGKDGTAGDWSSIPAIVHGAGDEAGEHAIRLQAHLVGPRQWRPYAKAKYLYDLLHKNKLDVSTIVSICGGPGKRREIEEYIQAFSDMQEYYVPLLQGVPVDQSRFSAFVELQKPSVQNSLTAHGHTKTDFSKWLGTPGVDAKFKPLLTVRQIPRILANPLAKQKFLARDATEAIRLLEQPASTEVIKDASLEQLASALTVKIRNLGFSDISALQEDPDGTTSQAIADCFLELQALEKMIHPNYADE